MALFPAALFAYLQANALTGVLSEGRAKPLPSSAPRRRLMRCNFCFAVRVGLVPAFASADRSLFVAHRDPDKIL